MSKDSPSCPNCFQFYTCYKFTECYTTNPRHSGDPYPEDQKQATYNATYTGIPHWYDSTKCENSGPLFKFCCKNGTSECASGCSRENFTQSCFEIDPDKLLLPVDLETLQPSPLSDSKTTSTDTLYGSGIAVQQVSTNQDSSSSSPTPTRVSTANSESQSALHTDTSTPGANTAAIAGGVAGGVVGLALLVGLLAICCRSRISKARQLDERRSPTWDIGQNYSVHPNDAELEEMKQGASPGKSH